MGDKQLKDNVRLVVKKKLSEMQVLGGPTGSPMESVTETLSEDGVLTFYLELLKLR